MKKQILLGIILVGIATSIQSQSPSPQQQEEIKKACINGWMDALGKLVPRPFSPDISLDSNDNFPLYYAAANNKLALVNYLIKSGATMNRENKQGYTALMIAAESGYPQIVEFLLLKNADQRNLGEEWNNAKQAALKNRSPRSRDEILQLIRDFMGARETLLPIKNNPKKLNDALRNAAKYGNYTVAQLALSWGASKTDKNMMRQTAYDIARKNNHQDLAKLLKP